MFTEYDEFAKIAVRKNAGTFRQYKTALVPFFEYFKIESLSILKKITPKQIVAYRETLLDTLSVTTANTRMRNISAFYGWLKKNEYIEKNVFERVQALKASKKLPVYLTEEEAKKLIVAGKTYQNQVMIALMLATGMRRDEVVKAKVTDVRNGAILVHGKGNKEREVPINDEVLAMLNKHFENHNSEYIFTSQRGNHSITGEAVRLIVKDAAERAGIDPDRVKLIHPHTLRHTIATRLVENNVNIRVVQEVLGHSSIATTERYTHVGNGAMRDALNKVKYL